MRHFDGYNIHQLREMVSRDKIASMRGQVEGWRALAYLFDTQYARLTATGATLASAWQSTASAEFLGQVEKVRTTLSEGTRIAESNMHSWNRVADQAEKTRDTIFAIEREYMALKGRKDAEFKREKEESLLPFGLGDPDKPNYAKLREDFDRRAQAAMEEAATAYSQEETGLKYLPPYQGPLLSDAYQKSWGDDGASSHPAGGGRTTSAMGAGISATSSDFSARDAGASLAGGAMPSTLPVPEVSGVVSAPAATFGGSGGSGGAGSLFPSMGSTGLSSPVGGSAASGGGSSRGSRSGVSGGRGLFTEPVIGSRSASGSLPPSGIRTAAGPGSPVIGHRAAPPGGQGRGVPGRRPMLTEADGVVRPVGRGGQPTVAGGVVRPGGRGGQPAVAGGVVRPGGRGGQPTVSGGMPGASRGDRRRRQDSEMVGARGEEYEVWEVDSGVDAVVEPPAVYDADTDQPGPFVGRVGRSPW